MKIRMYIWRHLKVESPAWLKVNDLAYEHGLLCMGHSRVVKEARIAGFMSALDKTAIKERQRRMVEIEDEIRSLIP